MGTVSSGAEPGASAASGLAVLDCLWRAAAWRERRTMRRINTGGGSLSPVTWSYLFPCFCVLEFGSSGVYGTKEMKPVSFSSYTKTMKG